MCKSKTVIIQGRFPTIKKLKTKQNQKKNQQQNQKTNKQTKENKQTNTQNKNKNKNGYVIILDVNTCYSIALSLPRHRKMQATTYKFS